MKGEVFLDSAYAIALSSPGDEHHERAKALAKEMRQGGVRLLVTRAVLVEIGNALSAKHLRAAGVRLLRSLETDPSVEILAMSDELYARALILYASRADKEWGMTDCASFVVMRDRRITEALTSDAHFRQAGFETLLP